MIRLTGTNARRILLLLLQDGDASAEEIGLVLEGTMRHAIQSLLRDGMIEKLPGSDGQPRLRRRAPPATGIALYQASVRAVVEDTYAPPTPSGVHDRSAWVTAERLRAAADLMEMGAIDRFWIEWLGPKTDAEMPPGTDVECYREAARVVGDVEPAAAPPPPAEPPRGPEGDWN